MSLGLGGTPNVLCTRLLSQEVTTSGPNSPLGEQARVAWGARWGPWVGPLPEAQGTQPASRL